MRLIKTFSKVFARKRFLVFTFVFAVIGVALLLRSFAATSQTSFEAEDTTLSGTASIGANANASGGNFVEFGAAGTAQIMRTDHVLDFWGNNIKVTYGYGTHGDTDTNFTAVKDLTKSMGLRVYRQPIASGGGTSPARQRAWMTEMNALHGTRFHITMGNLRNAGVPTMTLAQIKAFAKQDIAASLAEVASYYVPRAPGGDLSRIIHSFAGPNEIEEVGETGPNWARNSRIYQEEIYEQARNGRDVAAYRTMFASVPICGPSTRFDLTLAKAQEAATAVAGDGTKSMPQFVECGNAHLYDKGIGTTEARTQGMVNTYAPIVGGDITKDFVFSETGYNNMTYNVTTGQYIGPSPIIPYTGGDGQKRIPPWAIATYLPRAVSQYAKMGITYIKHEFLDDVDTAWDQEHFFGMISTPSVDPSTWVKKPEYYSMRRFYNLLEDRGANPTQPPTHATTNLAYTVETNAAQLRQLLTQKSDGSWWLLLWRDVDVWDWTQEGQSPGRETPVANMNFTIKLNQARTVQAWQPNKASNGNLGSTADWATIPAPEESWTVPAGGTFTIGLKGDLKAVRIQ